MLDLNFHRETRDLPIYTSSFVKHVSRAMLSRYSHVRLEAKRRALDEIAARQKVADGRSF